MARRKKDKLKRPHIPPVTTLPAATPKKRKSWSFGVFLTAAGLVVAGSLWYALSSPSRKPIAYEIIQLESQELMQQPDLSELERVLGEIFEEAEKELAPQWSYSREEAVEILSSIGLLLQKMGFRTMEKNVTTLSTGLQRRTLDCDPYAVIYYSIGQETGIPIDMLALPEHVIVGLGTAEGRVLWETLSSEEKSLDYYLTKYNIGHEEIEQGTFLTPLTREQILACFYGNIGVGLRMNDYDTDALPLLDKALELDPKNVMAWLNLADAKRTSQDLKGALKDAQEAHLLAPNYYAVYRQRGSIKERMNDFDGALADFAKAIELFSQDPFVYFYRSTVFMRQGKTDQAIADLSHSIELSPTIWQVFAERAECRLFTRDFSGSLDDARKALTLSPTNSQLQGLLLRINAIKRSNNY